MGPAALLFLRDLQIVRLNVAKRNDVPIATLPSSDVAASPRGHRVAYVIPGAASGVDEDFVAVPELHVYDLDSGRDVTVGAGFGPLWHPSGERLAYLEPVGPRACEGETCATESEVVVAHVRDRSRASLTSNGHWALLGWAGDGVVVGDQDRAVALLATAEEARAAPFAPSQFWGASPDGERFLLVGNDGPRVTSFDAEEGVPVDVEGRLGTGAWSPDGTRVVAVLLGDERSELVIIDPVTGAVEPVAGSSGAAGQVVWSEDGDTIAYAKETGGGLRLRALRCRLAPVVRCRPLFSWARGVALLAVD